MNTMFSLIIVHVSRIEAPRSLRPRVLLLLRKNNNSGDASSANKARAILHNCRRVYRRSQSRNESAFWKRPGKFHLVRARCRPFAGCS